MTDQRAKDIVDGLGEAAGNDADRQASQQIVSALRTHRDSVSGISSIPLDDPQLSSKVMADARSRSQEIREASAAKPVERPIPLWLWLAWLLAIAAFAVAWWKLSS